MIKRCIAFFVCLACASAAWTADPPHRIHRLGNPSTAFYTPPLKTQADLLKMLQASKVEIQQVLSERNFAVKVEDILKAVEQGKVKDATIDPGAPIPFMVMRKDKKVVVFHNAVWVGSKSFEAFLIEFESVDYKYRLYVPKPCGNFWMEQTAIVKAPEPPKPPEAPKPAPEPPKPAPEPPKPAPVKEVPPPPPAVEELGMFFVAGFFGKERMEREEFAAAGEHEGGRCAPLFGVKVGILPPITEYLEGEVSVGGKLNVRDGENSSVFADLALNALLPRCFVGAGVSFWDLTDDDTRCVALLAQAGVDITEDRRWQFVAEGRLPTDELNDAGSNYMFWGGIRFRI